MGAVLYMNGCASATPRWETRGSGCLSAPSLQQYTTLAAAGVITIPVVNAKVEWGLCCVYVKKEEERGVFGR